MAWLTRQRSQFARQWSTARDNSQGPRRGRRTTSATLVRCGWAKVSRRGGRDAVQGRIDVDGDCAKARCAQGWSC